MDWAISLEHILWCVNKYLFFKYVDLKHFEKMCLKTKQTTLKKKHPKKYLKKIMMAKKLKSNFMNLIPSNISRIYSWNSSF